MALTRVVTAQRHAHGPVAIARDAEVATESRVLAVGGDDVATTDLRGGAGVFVLDDDAFGRDEFTIATLGGVEQPERLHAVQDVGA